MTQEFESKRTELANGLAVQGAVLLHHTGAAAALAAIPNSRPQQYVVAGTVQAIVDVLPKGEQTTHAAPSAAAGEPVAWIRKTDITELTDTEPETNGWTPLYAHPAAPVQPTTRPTDDHLWDETLRDRDTYHEWADKLAEAIAAHFGVDIGEHSNVNCPWAEALEVIEAAPVQPVGTTVAMPGSGGGFTMCAFNASDVPVGTKLYVTQSSVTSSAASQTKGGE